MTKDEALRLALDVLQDLEDTQSYWWQEVDEATTKKIDPAITAIKAALEAKDEPVAWRALNWGHSPDEYVYRDFDDPVMGIDGKPSPNNEPLYTTPPQRKPLTDEEIDKAWRSVDYTVPWDQHRIDIARAIEAKLKEKNT